MTAEVTEGTVSRSAEIAAAPVQPKGWLLCQKMGMYWNACYPGNVMYGQITPTFLFETKELAMKRAAELATGAGEGCQFKVFYLEF